jgi:hypothetical protein
VSTVQAAIGRAVFASWVFAILLMKEPQFIVAHNGVMVCIGNKKFRCLNPRAPGISEFPHADRVFPPSETNRGSGRIIVNGFVASSEPIRRGLFECLFPLMMGLSPRSERGYAG